MTAPTAAPAVLPARSWAALKPGEAKINAGRATFFDEAQAQAWCQNEAYWDGIGPRGRDLPPWPEAQAAGYRVVPVEIRAKEGER